LNKIKIALKKREEINFKEAPSGTYYIKLLESFLIAAVVQVLVTVCEQGRLLKELYSSVKY
jgi:hypothetical protein